MAGVADLAEATSLLNDSNASIHRRSLAARALGLLGDEAARESLWITDPRDESPFGRACYRAILDGSRRITPEFRLSRKEEALEHMRQLGVRSIEEAIRILQDTSEPSERREAAASILGGLRSRHSVAALIEVLAEGDLRLSWACMFALTNIGSRRGARRLIAIARGSYPLQARQEAIYALWQLDETRAESLFIQLSRGLETEEEYTSDMATEALGNTCWRPATQKALAERLFDPSPSVRYSALCACSRMFPQPYRFPDFLRRALVAKLDDPDRVDDDRVIATMAGQLLGRK